MKARAEPVEQQKRAAWFALVSEHLPLLYRFVRHEIAHSEAEGELLPDELSAEDVIDTMLLRAQKDFVRHPPGKGDRGWLIKRAREQLDADIRRLKSRRARTVPLETDTSEFPTPAAAILEGGDVMFYEPQDLTPEDLFPDVDLPPSPEQAMEAQEMQSCVNEVLAEMPNAWRQALHLHYLEGLGPGELAAALGNTEADTRRLLEQARDVVRQKLKQAGCSFKPAGER